MQLSVNGMDTFVATGGRAFETSQPTIVLLHGAGFDHSTWALHSRWFAHHGRSVLAIVFGLLILLVTLELLRRRQLREKYAALWIVISIFTVVIAVFPAVLYRTADLLGKLEAGARTEPGRHIDMNADVDARVDARSAAVRDDAEGVAGNWPYLAF